ncbi:hypothetical protein ACOME3_001424 [Neoechinorhynchus agilis]
MKLWDLRTKRGCELTMFDLHETDINCAAFFPNGNAIATGSDDCFVHLVDLRSACKIGTYWVPSGTIVEGHESSTRAANQRTTDCCTSTNCASKLTSSTHHHHQQQQQQQQQRMNRSDRVDSIVSERSAESGLNGEFKYDQDTNHVPSPLISSGGIPITSMGFSLSGRLMFGGCDNFDCVLWDVLKQQCIDHLHGHENRVQCLGVSRKANAVATGSWDSIIRIWN